MGSVGVYTGRLTGSQFGSFLSDTNSDKRFGNITAGKGKRSFGFFPDKIVVRNEDNSYSYTINFEGMRLPKRFQNAGAQRRRLEIEKRKDAYLRALRGSSNTDNSQSTYDKVYREAIAQGKSEQKAINEAQRARSRVAKEKADNVRKLAKFRKMGIKITSRRKL